MVASFHTQLRYVCVDDSADGNDRQQQKKNQTHKGQTDRKTITIMVKPMTTKQTRAEPNATGRCSKTRGLDHTVHLAAQSSKTVSTRCPSFPIHKSVVVHRRSARCLLSLPSSSSSLSLLLLLQFLFIVPWSVHSATTTTTGRSDQPPNVVILLADNLGYNDISSFGAPTAETPNIDSIGRNGMKLNNWNSAAHLCSASRAAILTGKYPARMGIYPRVFHPDAEYGLMPEEMTLAEHLKESRAADGAGYATGIVGKWHLGHRPDYLPTNQGFDECTHNGQDEAAVPACSYPVSLPVCLLLLLPLFSV